MYAYVARQPILDKSGALHAYELLFRNGESNQFPGVPQDEATSKLLAENHLMLGIEDISDGQLAFINFHQDALIKQFPTFLDPKNVVIEIVESVEISDELVNACQQIKQLGYSLALDDYDFSSRWEPLIPLATYIKIDVQAASHALIEEYAPIYKARNLLLVAERIETPEELDKYSALGFDFFQGYHFAKPELVKKKSISASKQVMLDLLEACNKPDFDFDYINDILTRDVALSYMLLRFINCPIINKRTKITSLKHALTFMGEVEVKKFVALLALANLADNKPMQLVQLSLVRAKFCELVARFRNDHDNPPKGFLVGLLSLLDAMLDHTMQDLLERIPLSEELKQALLGIENTLKIYLSLARAFEEGNWSSVKRLSTKLNLDQRLIHSFYNESIKWSYAMTNAIKK
ncbi:HDOD domain-containing protein [Aestuariibacter sp. AA17]|uniref:HDOD domain-containing protein n=1 Tax=Fluctibacter corallii TaxID=2984329 RepID=A0ABT3A6I6_9ALTE|nr:HDOD domain-containing protein [Aestuariibacter sp. AA17]MCV2884291.1 HDOD domain-containing protein [Aestuariibacter sp. AA17]